jgi:hypothetical protein
MRFSFSAGMYRGNGIRAIAVVQMCAGRNDGGNCAGESVFLVPRFRPDAGREQQIFIRMTQAEVVG